MSDRRSFLKTSAATVSAVVVGCSDSAAEIPLSQSAFSRLQPGLVDALAEVVLPSELRRDGVRAAAASFRAWCAAYEPVAELNHGYGTSEIRYLPEHPEPRWSAQLDALDREAHQRFETGFESLELGIRRDLVAGALGDNDRSLGRAFEARHVAVGLLSHWTDSTEATDLCYGVPIGKLSCRGLDGLRDASTAGLGPKEPLGLTARRLV